MLPTLRDAMRVGWLCVFLAASVIPDAWAQAAAPDPTPEDELIELVNIERWNNGALPPLKRVAELDTSADGHAENMAIRDFFMHCDPDTGKSPYDRMMDAGYTGFSFAGENLAAGYTSAAAVVAAWMGNSSHRANLLSPNYREVGSGYGFQADDRNTVRQDANGDCVPDSFNNGPYYRYWNLNFGQRGSVYPLVINREAFAASSIAASLYVYGPGNATQMRFSNDAASWSAWLPYAADASWSLSPGNGLKTVYSQVMAGSTTYSSQDSIWLDAPPPAAPDVDIAPASPGVELTWTHAASNLFYDVYRSTDHPYFVPGGGDSTRVAAGIPPPPSGSTVTFTDATAGANYYYVVRAVGGDGETPADSNRVGRFEFPLSPGGG